MTQNLALSVLEVLKEEFINLSDLQFSDFEAKKQVRDFLEEQGEGFQVEGNYFGAFLEDKDVVHYISFTDDAPNYILLEKEEEFPIYYSGTDIVDCNRIVYKSGNGFYANYDHNRSFYFDFDNYPDSVVEEWTTQED